MSRDRPHTPAVPPGELPHTSNRTGPSCDASPGVAYAVAGATPDEISGSGGIIVETGGGLVAEVRRVQWSGVELDLVLMS